MKRIITSLFLAGLLFGCSLFDSLFEEDEAPKLDPAEFYETGDSEYPVIAVDETQTIFGFSSDLDQLYVQLSDGDQWIVEMGDNGYPQSMYVQKATMDLLLLFSEFDGNNCNVAVINQTSGTTEYFYDIEFSNISKTSSLFACAKEDLKSAAEANEEIMGWWETYGEAVKKMVGPVLGGIGCGVSLLAVGGSAGMATPIAVLNCSSFALSLTGDIVGEESTAGGAMFKGGAVVGKYGEMVLKCGFQNWGSCALAICGEIGAINNLYQYGKSKNNVTEAENHLTAYAQSGGLAGTWTSDEIEVAGGSYSAEYYFGLNAGRYTQISKQSGSGVNLNTKTKLTFNYSVNNNTFTTTMTRVEMEVNGTQAGQSYSESFGPWTWEEFMQTAQYQNGGFPSSTTTVDFEIKDNGQKLQLSNGQTFTRTN